MNGLRVAVSSRDTSGNAGDARPHGFCGGRSHRHNRKLAEEPLSLSQAIQIRRGVESGLPIRAHGNWVPQRFKAMTKQLLGRPLARSGPWGGLEHAFAQNGPKYQRPSAIAPRRFQRPG